MAQQWEHSPPTDTAAFEFVVGCLCSGKFVSAYSGALLCLTIKNYLVNGYLVLAFVFRFVNHAEAQKKLALINQVICTGQQQTEGFWQLQ